MYYIHVGGLWVRDRGCLGGECNKASYYLQFEEMEHVLGEEYARGADSKAERTSDFVYVPLTRSGAHVRRGTKRPHEEGDRTERCWRMSKFMACADRACIPLSRSLPASRPCNIARSLTLHYLHDNYRQAPCRKFENRFRGRS